MKILVVDDELVSRMKMKRIMESFGKCTEADGGLRAIALFHEAREKGTPFDLISMDISMPDMDGTEALKQIREFEKNSSVPLDQRVKVFMVTASRDRETIISCIKSGCSDYIMKPFSRNTIMKKLVENGLIADDGTLSAEEEPQPRQKRSMLDYIIEQFRNGEIDLPSLSKVYAKFNELMDKNADLQEIGELLQQDPAICSKLISISNSAYYRGAQENHTLEQSISRLGMKVTKQTVDIISQKSLYFATHEKYSHIMEALWEHSLSCAHGCQIISEMLGIAPPKDLFTMGLLHDIGKLFLLQVVGEIEKRWTASEAPTREELEEWLFDNHSRAGSTLLAKWGFSPEFSRISMNHHDPGDQDVSFELLAVHTSNEIVRSMGYTTNSSDNGPDPAENEIILKLGLTPRMIDEIKVEINSRMEHLREYLN